MNFQKNGYVMKTYELEKYLDDLLFSNDFQDASLNGLQVYGKDEISSCAFAVTASLNVIEKAKELGVDALIVHHGILLRGKDFRIVGTVQKKLKTLLTEGVSLFGYHLPLDACQNYGNNWPCAKMLGFENLIPFGKHQNGFLGVAGFFKPRLVTDLQNDFKKIYGTEAKVVLGGKDTVTSCAILSGKGHNWIDEAVEMGIDCFVTGTSDEPIWHIAHEEKINFFAFGHAATEKIGVRLLQEHLQETFQFKTHFIDEENPF